MFPVPLAAKPIDVVLFDQLNTVPDTSPEKEIPATVPLLQTCWFVGSTTFGMAFTVIVID